MAFEITIPRLDWSMEEGVFVEWIKQEGDRVEAGDSLFTLESEKAIQEIESLDAGILRIHPNGPQEGETILVGALLGYLVEPDEEPPFQEDAGGRGSRPAETPVAHASPSPTVTTAPTTVATPPTKIAITPRAARTAVELGVEWSQLQGTGRDGRIREQDIRAAQSQPTAKPTPKPDTTSKTIALSPTRQRIAQRMADSAHTTAPVTLTTTVDATHLVSLRQQFQATATENQPAPSYNDFIIKLVAKALAEHPLLNSSYSNNQITLSGEIHIGIAVDTEAGLLVPVIRNAPSLSIHQIAETSRDLARRARARQLSAAELKDGTFTITNLGVFGIDAFTPIINLPQSAILGIGRIHRQPAVVDNEIVPRDVVTLNLTFDHRIIDGTPAARFLETISNHVKNPAPHLLT